MEKRIIILSSQEDYWEACYVDGKCVEQAHHLGEGNGKISFLKEICKKHNATLDDVLEVDAEEEDDQAAMDCGSFPDLLDELEGGYNFS